MTKLRNREEYEAPVTTKRVVQMEGSACVVASGEPVEAVKFKENKIEVEDYESVFNDISFD